MICETIQHPGIESIRVAQRLMFLSVQRDFHDVVRRDAFQKQPVFEQMAEQIALSAASDAGDLIQLNIGGMAFRIGRMDCPSSDRAYSTRGGTSA